MPRGTGSRRCCTGFASWNRDRTRASQPIHAAPDPGTADEPGGHGLEAPGGRFGYDASTGAADRAVSRAGDPDDDDGVHAHRHCAGPDADGPRDAADPAEPGPDGTCTLPDLLYHAADVG